jgi:tryptophanyl-tRNA synthetase
VAQRFNHLFGRGKDFFVLPEANVEEEVALLPGLDGRKMSKSYDNAIPLFEGGAKGLKEAIARIVTDSKLPGEAKDPDSSHLVTIYDAFATPVQRAEFRQALRAGLAWGEAKQQLFELIEAEIGPLRLRYEALMAHPERIEAVLQEGAAKARALAAPLLAELREAVGLRRFTALRSSEAKKTDKPKSTLPVFKQYREADGKFYFKLTDAAGRVLLQSLGLEQGKLAGQWVARLKQDGAAALADAPVQRGEGVSEADLHAALAALLAEQG